MSKGIAFADKLISDKKNPNKVKDSKNNSALVSIILDQNITTEIKAAYIKALIELGTSPFIPPMSISSALAHILSEFIPKNEMFITKDVDFVKNIRDGYNIVYNKSHTLRLVIEDIKQHYLETNRVFYGTDLSPLLNIATLDNNIPLVHELLHHLKADPNMPDAQGRTPLTIAINKKLTEITKILITNGANITLSIVMPNNIDALNQGALKFCNITGKEFIEHAINTGNSNSVVDHKGRSAIISLIYDENLNDDDKFTLTSDLLKHNHNLHTRTEFNILKQVLQQNYFDIAELLIDNRAETSKISGQHLRYIIESKKYNLALKLINANISVTDIGQHHIDQLISDNQLELENALQQKIRQDTYLFKIKQQLEEKNAEILELKTLMAAPWEEIKFANDASSLSNHQEPELKENDKSLQKQKAGLQDDYEINWGSTLVSEYINTNNFNNNICTVEPNLYLPNLQQHEQNMAQFNNYEQEVAINGAINKIFEQQCLVF